VVCITACFIGAEAGVDCREAVCLGPKKLEAMLREMLEKKEDPRRQVCTVLGGLHLYRKRLLLLRIHYCAGE